MTTTSLSDICLVNGLAALLVSLIATSVVIPTILRYAYTRGIFDGLSPRKVHTNPVPRLGGLAFMPVIMLAMSAVVALDYGVFGLDTAHDGLGGIFGAAGISPLQASMLVGALMVMYLTGLADDFTGMRFPSKLATQVLSASLIALSGTCIGNLHGFLGFETIPYWGAVVLTVMVVILIINAVNFIDGIDGLASALCTLALIVFAMIFYRHGAYVDFALSLAAIGTLVPFFCFNVFGRRESRTKIFMGDTGALTMGALTAFLAVRLASLPAAAPDDASLLVSAFVPLLIPCMDVVRVALMRMRHGRNPFLPDRSHIHHKLMGLGLTPTATLLTLTAASAALTAANLALAAAVEPAALLAGDVTVWTAANLLLSRPSRRAVSSPAEAPSSGSKS